MLSGDKIIVELSENSIVESGNLKTDYTSERLDVHIQFPYYNFQVKILTIQIFGLILLSK